jgi:hypothetical protein
MAIIECRCGELLLIIGAGQHRPRCPKCAQKLILRPQEPWAIDDGTVAELAQEVAANAPWAFGNDGTSNRITTEDNLIVRSYMHFDFGGLWGRGTNGQKVRDLELDQRYRGTVRRHRKFT